MAARCICRGLIQCTADLPGVAGRALFGSALTDAIILRSASFLGLCPTTDSEGR
jgi:hypothetical protein